MAIQKQTRLTLIVDAGIVEQVLQVLTGIADLSHQDFKIAVEEIASDNLKDLSSEVVNSGDKDVNSEDRGMSSWGEDYSPEEDSLAKEDPEMELLHTEKALRVLQALRDIQLLDEDFQPEYLELPASVTSEEYYVKMVIAWYFATALAKQWDAAIPYIEQRRLSDWVHRKTIRKAVESYRITKEQKDYLRTLK